MTITNDTVVDLNSAPEWFIDTPDFICTYPSNVALFLTEERWENLTELVFLSGELEDGFVNNNQGFCEWLAGEMGKSVITIGEFAAWIDEQEELYL